MVEKPRGHNHIGGYMDSNKKGSGKKGGILGDDEVGGGDGNRGKGGKVQKKGKKNKSAAALTVADMMLPKNNFVR